MNLNYQLSRLSIALRELRAPFFTASIIPVLVGTALAYAAKGIFNPLLFTLATITMIFLHAGANMANDYFDHLSGNDWGNRNPTPFSGGSQLIQQGLISPKAVITAALIAFTAGAILGFIIVVLTRSFFLVLLGLTGILGGFFYTAPPFKLGYRTAGELVITLMFGILPIYGSYYLQTTSLDLNPLLPGLIVAALIFLVILANEFPDAPADRRVNKRTLVVTFGTNVSAWIYRIVLTCSYILALISALLLPYTLFATVFYLITIPMAVLALKALSNKPMPNSKGYRFNQITILLHLAGGMALTLGLAIAQLIN